MFDPGVRQAYIDLAPALRGDRCVKNHNLAVFRLQQYNCFLQVCLCPTLLLIYLLPLFYLARSSMEADAKVHKQQICSKIKCDDYLRGLGSGHGSRCKNRFPDVACTRASIIFNSVKLKHRKRTVLPRVHRVVIQLLLLKARDVEVNPGPKNMFSLINKYCNTGSKESYRC